MNFIDRSNLFCKLLLSTSLLSLIVAIFSFYWTSLYISVTFEDSHYRSVESTRSSDLFIGITSSPDHALQRQSLRDTWLQLLPHSYHYVFLVGEKMCNVHPSDRSSQYACDSLNFVIPTFATVNTLFYTNSIDLTARKGELEADIEFHFHVHQPIVIHFLGLERNTQLEIGAGLARVVLTELPFSSAVVASVTFNGDFMFNDSYNNGYIFKKLQTPVVLPKGFEGSVKVEGVNNNKQDWSCRVSTQWSHGNLFTVYKVNTRNSITGSNSTCILPTFSFTIEDVDKLRAHMEGKEKRTAEWLTYTTELRKQLEQEAARYSDILFLKMVDVYRNLPQKVLLFFKWVYKYQSVKYVLKTDDDTFIDILNVKVELDKNYKWDWWSCFRVGWPINKHGKWRETVYQQDVYPMFPSGAGYVLSKRSLTWLNNREHDLTTSYAGEDVAVGIWFKPFNASRHVGETCYWACNEDCYAQNCNAMQLSVQNVYQMWRNYQRREDMNFPCSAL